MINFKDIVDLFNKPKVAPKYVAIDLGTDKSLAYVSGSGIIFNEPSVIAHNIKNQKFIGIGDKAYKLIGKSSKNVYISRILRDAAVVDISLLKEFLIKMFSKIRGGQDIWKNSIVVIACPESMAELERTSVKKLFQSLGAGYVAATDATLLGALGAGCDIYAPTCSLILDIGAGKSSCAIISANDVVFSESVALGGMSIDIEILKFVRSKYGVSISSSAAEKIKKESDISSTESKKVKTYGRDIITGMPKEFLIDQKEINKVITSCLNDILIIVGQVIEQASAELSSDIINKGITVIGGIAELEGLNKYLADYLRIPLRIIKSRNSAVMDGAIKYEKEIIEKMKEENEK